MPVFFNSVLGSPGDSEVVYNLGGLTGDTPLIGHIWGRVTSPKYYWFRVGAKHMETAPQPVDLLGYIGLTVFWRAGSGLRVHLWAEDAGAPNGATPSTQFATADPVINAASSLRLQFNSNGAGGVGVFAPNSIVVSAWAGDYRARWAVTATTCLQAPD